MTYAADKHFGEIYYSPIKTRSFRITVFLAFVSVTTALAFIQIGLGSPFFLTFIVWLIGIVSILFLLPRILRISDFLMLLFGFYFSTGTLLIKTSVGQPLDSNLITPHESATYLLIAFFSLSMAGLLARNTMVNHSSKLSRRMETFARDVKFLLPVLAIGLGARLLFAVLVKGEEDSGLFGGGLLNSFLPVLQLGIVMALYHAAQGKRIGKVLLALSICIVLYLAIIANAKKEFVFLMVPVFVAVFSLRIKVPIRQIIPAAILIFILIWIVVPAVQIVRKDVDGLGPSERLAATWNVIYDAGFSPAELDEQQARQFQNLEYAHRPYSSYVYPSAANVDRFMFLFPTDQVVRGLNKQPQIDFAEAIDFTMRRILPSFLVQKREEALVDLVAWNYGIRATNSIARPVLGIPATSIAVGGILGALLIPFVAAYPIMVATNVMFGPLRNSIFAATGAGFVAPFVEKSFTAWPPVLFRELIILWAMLSAIYLLRRFLVSGPSRKAN